MTDDMTIPPATQHLLDEAVFKKIKPDLKNSLQQPYPVFIKGLKPYFRKVWMDIILGWIVFMLILGITFFMLQYTSNIPLIILIVLSSSVLCGLCINYLVNFFHEAAHYNIAANRRTNDTLANICIGVLTGQRIQQYRHIHWQHHLHLGTQNDTEITYFQKLNLRFIIESLTGIRVIKVLSVRKQNTSKQPTASNIKKIIQLAYSLIFHGLVMGLFFLSHNYLLIVVWLLSFGSFYPFFNSLRQLLEHRLDKDIRYDKAPDSANKKLSRFFGNTFFENIFGSAGFNRHLLHHLEPQISYTRLHEVELFLLDTAVGEELKNISSTYPLTFLQLYQR